MFWLWLVIQSAIVAYMLGVWFTVSAKFPDEPMAIGLGGMLVAGLFLGWAVTFLVSLSRDILMGLFRTWADRNPQGFSLPRFFSSRKQAKALNGRDQGVRTAPRALDHS